ncbi:MAG: Gfo/Idh/MocA family oxidoreductase, partial [Acidimicrobiia bacterium]|nr:Gfo/Idh/MocA family oxidoreductase [Acidimicrobiia bacterium]
MTYRWGIVGTGRIAVAMVEGIRDAGGAVDVIASSSPERASAFAFEHDIPTSVSPHSAASHTAVDAVYIATTNNLHHPLAIEALQAGKAVLCEKPVALNVAQTTEMIEAAKANDTFLMEAMWMVFQPYWRVVDQWLDQIGEVRWVQSDFGFPADFLPDDRLLDPALGGGS